MSHPSAEEALEIYLDPEGGLWRDFREKLVSLPSATDPRIEQQLFHACEYIKAAQRRRRGALGQPALSLEHLKKHGDVTELKLMLRELARYRERIKSDLHNLKNKAVSEKLLDILDEEIHYSDDYMFCFEEALQAKGVGRTKVDELVEPITTKIQLKIGLRQKFDELKRQTPVELHPDLDKAFRQAIEQLDTK